MTKTQNHILMEIAPRLITLGGDNGPQVHRLIPYAKKRMIGPFIFFDYLPRTQFSAGEGLDVRPHPHIGLSTLSYLLEGKVLHHDSLGSLQVLEPGDVNWMTAGIGISHSERTPHELHGKPHSLHLLQFWVALPKDKEDMAPTFTHHEKSSIPRFKIGDAEVSLVAGSAFGRSSPVEIFSPLFFMDVTLKQGGLFEFDPGHNELAFFVLQGTVGLDARIIGSDDFVVLEKESSLKLKASEDCRFVVLGGEPFPEPRHIFWNYVSSSKEKISKANNAWISGEFPQVPNETDILLAPKT